jgi:hypothetical protein
MAPIEERGSGFVCRAVCEWRTSEPVTPVQSRASLHNSSPGSAVVRDGSESFLMRHLIVRPTSDLPGMDPVSRPFVNLGTGIP